MAAGPVGVSSIFCAASPLAGVEEEEELPKMEKRPPDDCCCGAAFTAVCAFASFPFSIASSLAGVVEGPPNMESIPPPGACCFGADLTKSAEDLGGGPAFFGGTGADVFVVATSSSFLGSSFFSGIVVELPNIENRLPLPDSDCFVGAFSSSLAFISSFFFESSFFSGAAAKPPNAENRLPPLPACFAAAFSSGFAACFLAAGAGAAFVGAGAGAGAARWAGMRLPGTSSPRAASSSKTSTRSRFGPPSGSSATTAATSGSARPPFVRSTVASAAR
mmetsp:Transcript_16792/g.27613  ORF Transcript_16792/g.27613 Transcript_16792/m.27613 type:complete len:276 (+) Transcript_16792:315-1142(+)